MGAERGREELNLWGPKWRHQRRESLFSCAYANHSRATCDLLRLRMLAREKVADLPRNFDYLHNLWGVEAVVRAYISGDGAIQTNAHTLRRSSD